MTDEQRFNHNAQKIEELYSTFQPMVEMFLMETEKEGFKLRITHGYRSIEEQNDLYAQGRTKPGKKVTNAKGGESFHNYGLAVDFYDEEEGYGVDWNRLEEIGDKLGLEHGDRGFQDLPHFQYRGGLTIQDVQVGARPVLLDLYKQSNEEDTMLDDHNREFVYLKERGRDAKFWVLNHSAPLKPTKQRVKKRHEIEVRSLFHSMRRVKSKKDLNGFVGKGTFKPRKLLRTRPGLFE